MEFIFFLLLDIYSYSCKPCLDTQSAIKFEIRFILYLSFTQYNVIYFSGAMRVTKLEQHAARV